MEEIIINNKYYHKIIEESQNHRFFQSIKTLCDENRNLIIFGLLGIYANETHIDDFEIQLIFYKNFPKSLPRVLESGNKIKDKDANKHFYTNGICCLTIDEEQWLRIDWDAPFKSFIDNLVYPFFFAQSLYRLTGRWAFGEYSHNKEGIIEFYKEKLGRNTSIEQIKSFIKICSGKDHNRGHHLCFCGSGKRFRDCGSHYKVYRSLVEKIPPQKFREYTKYFEREPHSHHLSKTSGLPKDYQSPHRFPFEA